MIDDKRLLGRLFSFLLVSFSLLAACTETSARNEVPAPRPTSTEQMTPTIAPTARSSPTAAPLSAAPEPAPSPTLPALANPENDYPLALGNIWVFESTQYQGYPPPDVISTTSVITETVVEALHALPYSAFRIHQDQSAETPLVVPASRLNELRPTESGDYWLVLGENRLYRQENRLDFSHLEQALVKFVFPLKVGDMWPLTENQTKTLPPGKKPGMTRQVVAQGPVVTPAGRFPDCSLFQEEWVDAFFEDWFCSNVGIVESKANHRGAPEGWHRVLTRYELKQ